MDWEIAVGDRLVTVAQFSDSGQADLAKQLLADFGIESFISGENFANMLPLGVKLKVLQSQIQQAQEILESNERQES